MKKSFKKYYWLIVAIVLFWCILNKSLLLLLSLGLQSKSTSNGIFFMSIFPDIVSIIAFLIFLWKSIYKITHE